MSATIIQNLSLPTPSHNTWLFNRPVDTLGLGGLSLLALVILGLLTQAQVTLSAMPAILFLGSLVVNYPHYAATYYRVYRRWEDVKQYPFETLWAPMILLALAFISFQQPATLAPWFCLMYLMFSGYHYSGQTYGVALIFAGKSGLRLSAWQKCILLAPIFAVYAYPMLAGQVSRGTPGVDGNTFYGMAMPALHFPEPLVNTVYWTFYAGLAAYVGLTIYLIRQKQPLPMTVHMVVVSHILWFYAIGLTSGYFMSLVPFFHCLQYLVITAYFHYRHSETPTELDAMGFISSPHFGRYYLWLVLVGALMFIPTPFIIEGLGWAKINVATAIVVSFINVHHFILDAAIWKLRKPEIGQPLMTLSSHTA